MIENRSCGLKVISTKSVLKPRGVDIEKKLKKNPLGNLHIFHLPLQDQKSGKSEKRLQNWLTNIIF